MAPSLEEKQSKTEKKELYLTPMRSDTTTESEQEKSREEKREERRGKTIKEYTYQRGILLMERRKYKRGQQMDQEYFNSFFF